MVALCPGWTSLPVELEALELDRRHRLVAHLETDAGARGGRDPGRLESFGLHAQRDREIVRPNRGREGKEERPSELITHFNFI